MYCIVDTFAFKTLDNFVPKCFSLVGNHKPRCVGLGLLKIPTLCIYRRKKTVAIRLQVRKRGCLFCWTLLWGSVRSETARVFFKCPIHLSLSLSLSLTHTHNPRPHHPGGSNRSWRGLGVWECISDDAKRREPKDSAAKEHEHSREAAVVLLSPHHRMHHVAGLVAGKTSPRHVHHWSQVSTYVGRVLHAPKKS